MDQCEECGFGDNVHEKDCWLKPENIRKRREARDRDNAR